MATKDSTKKSAEKTPTSSSDDLGAAEVQRKVNEAEEKGYLGVKVDPTPNENYSMQTPPDAPTPETDPKLATKAREGARTALEGGEK